MSTSVAVETEFDWATFAERYWDRSPVLFRALSPAPFEVSEVFRAAVHGSPCAGPEERMPPHAQLTVERVQRHTADGLLPTAEDGGFDGYDTRLATRLGGLRYALVVNDFHAFDAALWSRERAFYAGLWEAVGLPLTGAITTLFHGTYEHSPVGVHKDRFATFMFGLRGRKRMRFWPRRPWDEAVSTKVDYTGHLPESFSVDVGPGELLYWPADYYHVGESATTSPATSVNVGVPRDEHHAGYEVEALIADLDPTRLTGRGSLDTLLHVPEAEVSAPGPGPDGLLSPVLPEAFGGAVRALADFARPERTGPRVTTVSLRHRTAGGFAPAPAAAASRALADADRVRTVPDVRVLWAPDGDGGTLCAANGHHIRTSLGPGAMTAVTQALTGPGPLRVADVLSLVPSGTPREEARALLERLESFRVLRREP
ncbi:MULTISPECIES: JmjC domain-containing protein [Streptomyces]|uniref:JmjC domain-containing protein n=1 Tax=Streptomyces TaxID=1883 RepID=UPI0018731740|nr:MULTISPECIES: cupin domain-containing protein [Streptomyces]MBE4768581.1 cupin [Streptomyces caniscabiei]MDX2953977.1 cupin [Streptomyces caniscabiei]UJV38647.1 cupin [Streptomyces sp. AMCC400023]